MDAPLQVTLSCRRCGETATLGLDWAVVDPAPAEVDRAWDGIVLSRIVRCERCGAEDDYDIRPDDKKRLVEEARRHPAEDAMTTGGARRARAVLRDGTVVKRPSQAIAHAREVAEENPGSAAALCRYGNVCSLYGLAEEAERAWRRAVEMSDEEAESAYNLAANLWYVDRWEDAAPFVQLTLHRYARAELRPGLREEIGARIASILEEMVEMLPRPLAIELAVDDGMVGEQPVVILSTADLRRIGDWERLGEILGSGRVRGASLTGDVPDPAEGPTNLERMIAGYAPRWSAAIPVGKLRPQWVPGRSSLSKKGRRKRAR